MGEMREADDSRFIITPGGGMPASARPSYRELREDYRAQPPRHFEQRQHDAPDARSADANAAEDGETMRCFITILPGHASPHRLSGRRELCDASSPSPGAYSGAGGD